MSDQDEVVALIMDEIDRGTWDTMVDLPEAIVERLKREGYLIVKAAHLEEQVDEAYDRGERAGRDDARA